MKHLLMAEILFVAAGALAFSPIGICKNVLFPRGLKRDPARRFRSFHSVAKTMTLVSAVLLVGVTGWKTWKAWHGGEPSPFIDASNNFISLALFGSLLSAGGISLASFEGRVEAAEAKVTSPDPSCPFETIWEPRPGWERHRPGNPAFCNKCPLGIDRSSSVETGLIHVCRVYDDMHRKWLRLSGTLS